METLIWIFISYIFGTLSVLWQRSSEVRQLRKSNRTILEENLQLRKAVAELSVNIETSSKIMVVTVLSTMIDEINKSMAVEKDVK